MARTKGSKVAKGTKRKSKKQVVDSSSEDEFPDRDPQSYFWNQEGWESFYPKDASTNPLKKGSSSKVSGNLRVVFSGRSLPLNFLRIHHFDNLDALITHQGWNNFMNTNVNYEPHMIRMFFHNLIPVVQNNTTGAHRSKVYGRIVPFSTVVISRYFFNSDMVDGVRLNGSNWDVGFPTYNYGLALRSLHEPTCTNHTSIKVGDLTIENRLLHHLITHIILPRGGNKTELTHWDVGLMFYINNRIKINLPFLIFTHVTRLARTSNASCVYAMPLTSLLIHLGCGSMPMDAVSVSDGKLSYSDNSLAKLFTQNPDTGVWGRTLPYARTVPQQPNVQESRSAPSSNVDILESGPSEPIIPPLSNDRFTFMEDGLRALLIKVTEIEKLVVDRTDLLENAIAKIDKKMDDAKADIATLFDSIHPQAR